MKYVKEDLYFERFVFFLALGGLHVCMCVCLCVCACVVGVVLIIIHNVLHLNAE